MSEYRKAKPGEKEACIEFADYVFSKAHCPHDFETLIPRVYGEGVDSASIHRIAVDDNGKIRALIAVLREELEVGGKALQAGFVGTVSVHPKARGEGHMKVLMGEWLKEMRETCDIAVLGGQRQRYEYFGFTRGGAQYKYSVNSSNLRHALKQTDCSDISFRPLEEVQGGFELVYSINGQRPARVERPREQIGAIVRNMGEKALAVLNCEKLTGYILVSGNGDTVCELGLLDTGIMEAVIKAYLAYAGRDEIEIVASAYDKALNQCIGRFAESYCVEPGEMYQIFDFANVLEAYLSLKQKTLGLALGEFSAVLDGQPVTVSVDENGVSVERVAKPGAVVLDKHQAQELLLSEYGRFMDVQAPAGWFPLPVFWYTADSF